MANQPDVNSFTMQKFMNHSLLWAIVKLPSLRLAAFAIVLLLSGCGLGQVDHIKKFRNITGIDLSSEDILSISLNDDHGGVLGDGELNLIIETPKSTIARIAATGPPWSQRSWKNGPVPEQILSNCIRVRDLETNPFQSSKIQFAAQSRGRKQMPWHNGDILVLDPEHGKIWLVSWDN